MTPDTKRKAVAHLMAVHRVSQRRACSALDVDRSMMRYQSRRADDVALRDAIRRVSKERRRFGYRRIHVMVRREGVEVNHKKLRRIYREEKLQVRRRGGPSALWEHASPWWCRTVQTRVGLWISFQMHIPMGEGSSFWRLWMIIRVRTWP